MNVVLAAAATSECSSGCESGWTLYLEHSSSKFSAGGKHQKMAPSHHEDHQGKKNGSFSYDDDDEEEEDLSMVSDASSGPPHFDHDIDEDEDEEEVFCYGERKKQSLKLSTHEQFIKPEDFGLDDTASSPIFVSKNNGGHNKGSSLKRMMEYSSQGVSATHFHQGRSTNYQEHYGFIQPPFSTKKFQQNQWS